MNKRGGFIVSAILFFLLFFALGVYIPILSLYLKDMLGLSGKQTGLIMSLVLVSSLLSPLVGSLIIDRIISKKWMLFWCSLFSALLLFYLAQCKTYITFLTGYVLYIICNSPILGIINAVALERIEHKDTFGRVRLCGTLGWVFASFFFGYFWIKHWGYERLGDSFILSGISFACFALFSLTMKEGTLTKVSPQKGSSILAAIIPLQVIKELLKPDLRIVLLLYSISFVLEAINLFGASPFLKQAGFDETLIMPIQTIGQAIEIVSLFSISYLLIRMGKKTLFRVSMVCQLLSLVLYAFFGHMKLLLYAGLMLQGIKIGFFIPVMTIYIDDQCDPQNRGAVHLLLSLIYGVSFFLGNNISGWVMDFASQGELVNFSPFWGVPLIITVLWLLTAEFFFNEATSGAGTSKGKRELARITREIQ